jgi:hypothetical protein
MVNSESIEHLELLKMGPWVHMEAPEKVASLLLKLYLINL